MYIHSNSFVLDFSKRDVEQRCGGRADVLEASNALDARPIRAMKIGSAGRKHWSWSGDGRRVRVQSQMLQGELSKKKGERCFGVVVGKSVEIGCGRICPHA
jgi:hypothetical protein